MTSHHANGTSATEGYHKFYHGFTRSINEQRSFMLFYRISTWFLKKIIFQFRFPNVRVMSAEKKKVYYYCAVPKCVNTSTNQPNKKFFSSPSDRKRRRIWLTKMKRLPNDLSADTTFYVCEDHFDVSTIYK